jgi:acyl-CoA thioesterase
MIHEENLSREQMLQELQSMTEDELAIALKAGRAARKTKEEGFYFLHHFFDQQRGLDGDKPQITMPLYDYMKNPLGIAHGGVTAFLADNVMGFASYMASRKWSVTVDMHMRYHKPARGEKLIATGDILSKGATFNTTRADIRDETGTLVASATGMFYFRPQDQKR